VKDAARSTPPPLPIPAAMGLGWAGRAAWSSIKAITVAEPRGAPLALSMTARLGGVGVTLTELFGRDAAASWALRRDLRVGKNFGQAFAAADGTLVLRHFAARGLTSSAAAAVDYVCEDYLRLSADGGGIDVVQRYLHYATGATAEQRIAGRRAG
jgi:hypothetical protein